MKTRSSKPIMKPRKHYFSIVRDVLIFALQKKQQVGESNTFIQTGDRDPRADMSKNIQVVSTA